MELLFLYQNGQLAEALIDSQGQGVADQREVYEGGARVRLEADTNGDGRPDVVQYFAGDTVVQQDEDSDFDGKIDARFRDGKPVALPGEVPAPDKLGALDCGAFSDFWR